MNARQTLLGLAGGAAAGYAAVRAIEALRGRVPAPAPGSANDASRYGRIRRTLAVADVVRSSLATVAFAYGPIGERLARVVEPLPPWARPGAFAAIASVGFAALEVPISFVEGYRIERRFGLTEQPLSSYAADTVKAVLLETLVSAAIATGAAAVLRRFPRSWPIAAAAGALGLYVVANVVVPLYVLPLFNTFEPLEGPLEVRLRALASRYGVGDAEILAMNMSKQTKKANAFVAGIGSTHRIVIGDTLLQGFQPEEIEFVIAHELGHYVSKDTWRLVAAAESATLALLLVAASFTGRDRSADAVRIARLAAVLTVGSQVLRPALAAFSRSREWAADGFARGATGNPQAGVAAFRRLRDQNLAEEDVPPWFEFFFGTHPSLGKRIAALQS